MRADSAKHLKRLHAYGGKLPELKERARAGGQAGSQLTMLAKPDNAYSDACISGRMSRLMSSARVYLVSVQQSSDLCDWVMRAGTPNSGKHWKGLRMHTAAGCQC
jgi:hypothetical protein